MQYIMIRDIVSHYVNMYRGEKGIVADSGIVADNDISRTIIVIKK